MVLLATETVGGGGGQASTTPFYIKTFKPPLSSLSETVEILLFRETVGETGINNIILDVYNSYRLPLL